MTFASQGLHKVVRFLIMILVIKHVGADMWGQIIIAMTVISYLMLASDFGDGIVASVFKLQDEKIEDTYLQLSAWKYCIVGVFSSCLFWALYAIQNKPLFALLGIYSLIICLRGLAPEWLFLRHEKTGVLNTFLFIRSFIQLSMLWIFRNHLDPTIFVFFEILAELIWLVFAFKIWPISRKRKFILPSAALFQQFFKLGLPIFLMNLAVIVHTSADIFILNIFEDHATVGSYSAVYKFVAFYYLLGSTLSIIFRARMARLLHSSRTYDVRQIISLVLKILFVFSLFYLFSSSLIIKPLLATFLSLPAINSMYVTELLGLYILFAFVSSVLVEYFVAAHRRKELFALAVTGAIVNVGSNFILIPIFSANGAALSTAIAEFVMMAWLFLRLDPLVSPKMTPLVIIQVLVPLVLVAVGIFTSLPVIWKSSLFILGLSFLISSRFISYTHSKKILSADVA